MNERIKELMLDAGYQDWFVNAVPGESAQCTTDALQVTEKFAELIVRECAKIVNGNDFEGSRVGDYMLFEHFGAEEK